MSATLQEPRQAPKPPQNDPPQRDIWSRRLAIGLPIVVVILLVVVANQIGGILIAGDLRAEYENLVAQQQEAVGVGEEPPDSAPPAAAQPPEVRPEVTVAVSLSEFAVTADVEQIPAWATVTFEVVNDGAVPHDLDVNGEIRTSMLDPGASETITYEASGSGALVLICTVPGHEGAGMRMSMPIRGDDSAATGVDGTGHDTGEHGAAADVSYATPDNAAEYTGGKPPLELRDPAAPELPSGTVHDVTFTVEEKVMQVAKDVWQEVWTFNGQAPGPTLRVKVGDTVNLTLRNPKSAGLGHSVDFHASQVAWNDEMRTINPGEELTYTFEATHAGVFMYHCGTAPALHHIGNGMYGAIIVEPKEGLPDVDHEFVFVQGEYYTGPQGEPGDLTKMAAGAPSPDYVVFNGVASQYADHPIEVGVGERIRTWVLNAGPSTDSSFHVVGTIFDTVTKEGVHLTRDNDGGWGSQAVDLAPAQGGYAEFTLAEDGMYPIVSHAFNQPGLGALGLFKAGNGGPEVAGGH